MSTTTQHPAGVPGTANDSSDHRAALVRMLDDQYQHLGLTHDPTATAQAARDRLLRGGVRPEDNALSCEIIAARKEQRH